MKRNDYDLALLGAGCFATLLVERLRQIGWSGRVILLDQRSRFDQTQRWCWWRHRDDERESVHGITREWSRYVFCTGNGRWQARELLDWRYVHVDSRRFYAAAHDAWEREAGVHLQPGVTVGEVALKPEGGWRVSTSVGDVDAAMVVDCRSQTRHLPPHAFAAGDGWWQSFEGRVVAEPVAGLDDRSFCLMDLDPSAQATLGFGYLLGLDDGKSLVEYTMFDAGPADLGRLGRALDGYMGRLGVGGGSLAADREHGWLPMTVGHRGGGGAMSGQPVRAGVAGGAARPASGYAFARIMRQASALAGALVNGGDPGRGLGRAHSVWVDRLDGVFLRTLGNRPELARLSFARLLEGLSGDQMASFMAERAGPATLARVLSVLPKGPFLHGAWRQWRCRHQIEPVGPGLVPLRGVVS